MLYDTYGFSKKMEVKNVYLSPHELIHLFKK